MCVVTDPARQPEVSSLNSQRSEAPVSIWSQMMSGYLHNPGSLSGKSRRNMGMSWPADIQFWRPLHVTERIFISFDVFGVCGVNQS